MESIPIQEGNMFASDESNIMKLRWQSDELTKQLWKNLAYMEVQHEKGKAYLRSTIPENAKETIKPPMNVEGARMVINIVESMVNPVVSLSKTHQDQSMLILAHIKQAVRREIAVNIKKYGITSRSKAQSILQTVETLALFQLMRPVNGHESKQAQTKYIDKNETGTYTTSNGSSWSPFSGNKGEQR